MIYDSFSMTLLIDEGIKITLFSVTSLTIFNGHQLFMKKKNFSQYNEG